MRYKIIFLLLLMFFGIDGVMAQRDSSKALSAARAWWHAVTFGDTAYLNSHSKQQLTVVFNNGLRFSRAGIIEKVATHDPAANIKQEWSDIFIQMPVSKTAVVHNRIVEKVGAVTHVYQFITVLVKDGKEWKVSAAQSTRILELAARVDLGGAGNLAAFTGDYNTPGGQILKISIKDSSLVLTEPSGVTSLLVPVGPGLFEIPAILSAGNVRFSFNRDDTGTVQSMTRITHKITTMKRRQ
jgi:hypothetical protein